MIYLSLKGFKVHYYAKDDDEKKTLELGLTFMHPNPWDVPKFRSGEWDGLMRKYHSGNLFSLGLLPYVVAKLKEENITIVWEESFEKPDLSWIRFSDGVSSEDRDYQRNSILKWFERRFGIIKIPTRGGKTYVTGEVIRLLIEIEPKSKFLFVTDGKDVFNPVRADLASFIGKTMNEIGEIREKKRNYEQVTVAMIQTLQSGLKNLDIGLKKWLKTVDYLIVDEIHEYYGKPRQDVLKLIKKNANGMLCLSASPKKDSDYLGWIALQETTGGIVYDIHQKELEDKGVLAKNKVLLITNEIDEYEVAKKTYREIITDHIHNSVKRNSILINIIKACDVVGVKTLVMFSSKQHGYLIAERTGKAFLSGDDDMDVRNAIKEAFLSLDGEILLVSEIWKKAITLPEVEVFVNADGGKEQTLVTQKKGRVLGTTDTKKKALVIDILDTCPEYFDEHSISRIEVYEDSNTNEEIDFVEDDKDLLENLIKYLKEWFHG
jgi:superfamily II DNA or RNA helicase